MSDLGSSFDRPPRLTWRRDLEEFEGPILSELRKRSGQPYLEKWCELTPDGSRRSLVVRSEQRAIAEYLSNRRTLLDLITAPNDDVGFVVDRKGGAETFTLVQVSKLPEQYLPNVNTKHDRDLRPKWSRTPQAFLIETWNPELVCDLEREYLNAFAFNYFLAEGAPSPGIDISHGEKLDGGFSYPKFLRDLRDRVPDNENAFSEAVAAASPGVLTIDAPAPTAGRLITALRSVATPETRASYGSVHDWSRLKEDDAQKVPAGALEQCKVFAALLHVDFAKLRASLGHASNVLLVGKVLASYFRQLNCLVSARTDGAEFLPLREDFTPRPRGTRRKKRAPTKPEAG